MKTLAKGLSALIICGSFIVCNCEDAQAAEVADLSANAAETQELYGPPPPPGHRPPPPPPGGGFGRPGPGYGPPPPPGPPGPPRYDDWRDPPPPPGHRPPPPPPPGRRPPPPGRW